ncbi:hypothetical protein [Loktanella sp. M215]|uniref:hypothetical protein n=1 Tax=Loktanella sp. M215 TaxID=2675431 RepID=UPI001F3CB91F|nr:hypothetical protein [Loktanella sp. M215]MCF7699943.1 hypothetical protein [Loktanella sp. M215]
MAREDYNKEIDIEMRRERWCLVGPSRLVKVQAAEVACGPRLPVGRTGMGVDGYFTVAQFIKGMDALEIRAALGLHSDSMTGGAVIYSFLRLPNPTEYVYELTADKLDGLEYTSISNPNYLPGSRKIHQWRILYGARIPVDEANAVWLPPGIPFRG